MEIGSMSKVYWLNTKWACGALAIDEDGKVDRSATCPYFIKIFRGKKYSEIINKLKYQKALLGLKEIGG
jgi:hypothetical protein